ncbi:calcineurin-like phosphoesterase C-terminal domain-containing protein [Prevotella sp. A2931]|uniref:Calcineurin-like phosphoesterase C-terminal domain-containing protein n=1 Tax=Prevotella illustrans TaxID=2800387 RepID=A0ABS3M4Z4_9BACT|nr:MULTISPECIES: calcineurin-like phosphoesterase family protein [Prevotella]MBO1363251.1 calcineurin-like phosphoesterase C-terminal domain-containing protein [Prevotella illustrans]PTL26604.1 metallophosphoesterase [Prevotella sp. oral taxon 820]
MKRYRDFWKSTYAILLLVVSILTGGSTACSGADSGKANTTPDKPGQETVVPDKEGMTLKGRVTCQGRGLAGVEVSDGIEVTVTGDNGVYYLPSKKKYGYVFITIPAGYEVKNKNGNVPDFFRKVNSVKTSTVERQDFELEKADNQKHAVIAMADFHLANRTEDLKQFATVATDINMTIGQLRQQGYKVYGLSLGDESWDLFWYENNFAIAEAMQQTKKIDAPFFHCMGNHDNDPYYADDWLAEKAFIDCFPVYYSFNAGNVHYVVLDDIQYFNAGAALGKIGDRSYYTTIIEEQMAWLKKDLALVKDKTQPLVIAFHAPLYRIPGLDDKGNLTVRYKLANADDLVALLKDYRNVHILSGHTHDNFNVAALPNIHEHNTSAICATWWWTGKLTSGKQHICCDGTPGGYGVYLFNGNDPEWYYKSKGFDKDYQFRTYDMNRVYIGADDVKGNTDLFARYAHGYDKAGSDNEVLINVWNYDKGWSIEVTEDGKALSVTRISGYDPLHILSYEAQRCAAGKTPTSDFVTSKTAHLFKVKAASTTSTLSIKVTDSFGHVYKEEMKRPKAFGLSMS